MFRDRFAATPAFRVSVPGRVNLIGDHIDYCGLAVLPAAIQRYTRLLVRPRNDARIAVACVDPRFGPRTFEVQPDPVPFGPGDWGDYAKAAIADLCKAVPDATGFDAIVESDIPVAAGLSSSSALVVGFGLAFLNANVAEIDRLELAARLARAERFVGTQGGGMDQAIVLAALEGHAGRIDFDPLRVTPIRVPADWRFIVAHSGVSAEKSGAAQNAYNERTVDVQNALVAVTRRLGLSGSTYRTLLDRHDASTLRETADAVLDGRERNRFLHVVGEATRVEHAILALNDGDAARFGRLMSESHTSLRDLFEVSVPALDALVSAFERGGAAGARLTGAGFGGCVVALTRETDCQQLLYAVRDEVFGPNVDLATLRQQLFVVEPAAGASVERLA